VKTRSGLGGGRLKAKKPGRPTGYRALQKSGREGAAQTIAGFGIAPPSNGFSVKALFTGTAGSKFPRRAGAGKGPRWMRTRRER